MNSDWKEFKRNDILFGVIIPIIVALLIIAFPQWVSPALSQVDPGGTLVAIIIYGLEEAILIVAVPMFLGLLWNQWAGGSSGFILASIYSLSLADQYALYGFGQDISLLGYVVSGMLTGYISGALNRGSFSFRRMLVSGLTASIVGGLILFLTYSLSPLQMTVGPYGFFITMLPRIIWGVIVPLIATVFTWYGIIARRTS